MTPLSMGDIAQALPLAEEAEAVAQRALGDGHLLRLVHLHNLGMVHWHMAHGAVFMRFREAALYQGPCDLARLAMSVRCLEEAVAGRRKLFGEAHPATRDSTHALRNVQLRVEEVEEEEAVGTMYTRMAKRRRYDALQRRDPES